MLKRLLISSIIHFAFFILYILLLEVLIKYFNIDCNLFKTILVLLFGIYIGSTLSKWISHKLIKHEKRR